MRRNVAFCLSSALFLFSFLSAQAQGNFAVVQKYVLAESNIENGEVISFTKAGYARSTISYDPHLFGVVTVDPPVEFGFEGQENAQPVATSGIVAVKVNGENGPIEVGDQLTSSSQPGVAMKATQPGQILGVAQEASSLSSGEEMSTIRVSLEIRSSTPSEYNQPSGVNTQVSELLALASAQDPLQTLRLAIAAFIVIATLLLSFFMFVRLGAKGIDAAGRNPLASRVILLSVGLNFLVSLGVLTAGMAGAYLLITYK